MKITIKILIITIFLSFVNNSFSQSVESLQLQKKKNDEEIKRLNKVIAEAKSNTKQSLNQVVAINRKIDIRRRNVTIMNMQMTRINQDLISSSQTVEVLKENLSILQKDYAKMIYNAYKTRGSLNKIMFILSADSFNKAYRRLIYLKQYSDARVKRADEIKKTTDDLQNKIIEMKKDRELKQKLIVDLQREAQTLVVEKEEQSKILQEFKSKENEYREELRKKEAIADQLRKSISAIIKEEMRKSQKNENATVTTQTGFKLTPNEKIISDNFINNKGNLPWPTSQGTITGFFGLHEHPVFKNIKIENDGVKISTEQGQNARAIFGGTVMKVVMTYGTKAVIIQHGEYWTIYSNLSNVFVNKGDKVTTKQEIGTIATDPLSNAAVLDFQIRKGGQTKLDPLGWIAK